MPYFVDETEYLEHYGVLGMKWGVRHDRKKSDSRYKKANELMEELDKWDYGPVVNGKKVNVENFNWGKDYRTQPIEELKKTKCGVCWDFVNYQHPYTSSHYLQTIYSSLQLTLPTLLNNV